MKLAREASESAELCKGSIQRDKNYNVSENCIAESGI